MGSFSTCQALALSPCPLPPLLEVPVYILSIESSPSLSTVALPCPIVPATSLLPSGCLPQKRPDVSLCIHASPASQGALRINIAEIEGRLSKSHGLFPGCES